MSTIPIARRAHNFELNQDDIDEALYACVLEANTVGVKVLLERGADVNAKNPYRLGRTPLHAAAEADYVWLCELLVEAGAHMESKNHEGETPLAWAMVRNSKDTSLWLIANGASLDNCGYPKHLPAGKEVKGLSMAGLTMRQAALRGKMTDRLIDLLKNHPPQGAKDDLNSLIKIAKNMRDTDLIALLQSTAAMDAVNRTVDAVGNIAHVMGSQP